MEVKNRELNKNLFFCFRKYKKNIKTFRSCCLIAFEYLKRRRFFLCLSCWEMCFHSENGFLMGSGYIKKRNYKVQKF